MSEEKNTEDKPKNRTLSKYVENPVPTSQLVLLAIFSLTVFFSLIGWASGSSGDQLRPLTLIQGLCVISFAITLNKGVVSTTLCVLIVGVLVAPKDYLLSIAHMVSGTESPFEDYAKGYSGENVTSPDEFVNRVLANLSAKGLDIQPDVKKQIGKAVSNEAIRALAAKVLSSSASRPFDWITSGPEEISERADQYKHSTGFREDMEFLRSEGLISFEGNKFGNAALTALGGSVADFLKRERPIFRESQQPNITQIPFVELGKEIKCQFDDFAINTWVKFEIENKKKYIIGASSQNGDPVISLSDSDGKFITSDDDSGEGTDAKVELELDKGIYILEVQKFADSGSDIFLKISEVK